MGKIDSLMNHVKADFSKRLLDVAMHSFFAEYENEEEVHFDLAHSQNTLIRVLHDTLLEVADNTERNNQRAKVKQFGELMLWILMQDPAYRDQLEWGTQRLLKRADELDLDEWFEEHPPSDPEGWYCNLHEKGEQESEETGLEGVGGLEAPFYPAEQNQTTIEHSIEKSIQPKDRHAERAEDIEEELE